MIEISVSGLLFLTFAVLAVKRSMTYMHIYQQEEYDSGRFIKWIVAHKAFDKRVSFTVLALTFVSLFLDPLYTNFLVIIAFSLFSMKQKNPRTRSKKKLVFTSRAKRIYFPALGACILLSSWCFLTPDLLWIWLFNLHVIPFAIIIANEVQRPYEVQIQQKYWQEAHNKLLNLKPTVIGITGSFGKTSVKHILGHILKMKAETLVTPGSVNTPMGITRIIREQLSEDHKYFIVEMGAYGPGSIERLCKLAPPDMGIITSIGHAHYERFKSLETVAETKYELAQSAVRFSEGMVIAQESTLRFEYTKNFYEDNANQFVLCGDKSDKDDKSMLLGQDAKIKKVVQTPKGLEIAFTWKSENQVLKAPIYGTHHAYNIVLAFAAAVKLGMEPEDIYTALLSLPQIQHRLEVKPQANGTTIIDDAYNSNPIGFNSALDLLGILGKEGRKILITPGMVELGSAHDEAHEKIGKKAGSICDIAIIVNSRRIPSFIDSFKTTGNDKTLIEVDSFNEAQKWINQNYQSGDVILVENDLPDLYENVPKM